MTADVIRSAGDRCSSGYNSLFSKECRKTENFLCKVSVIAWKNFRWFVKLLKPMALELWRMTTIWQIHRSNGTPATRMEISSLLKSIRELRFGFELLRKVLFMVWVHYTSGGRLAELKNAYVSSNICSKYIFPSLSARTFVIVDLHFYRPTPASIRKLLGAGSVFTENFQNFFGSEIG